MALNGEQRVRAETLVRVPIVAGWLVEGLSRQEMNDAARAAWGIAPRTVDRLVADARAELMAEWNVQRPELTAQLLCRYDLIFRQAMAGNNLLAALGAVHGAARLAKL